MNPHLGGEVRNQVWNFETDPARLIDAAMGMGIDRLDRDFQVVAVLSINRCCNDSRREAGKGSDLDDPSRPEDADKCRQKKVIAGANATRVPDLVTIDHRVEEVHLARGRNLSRVTQFFRELSILDL